jgi:hypothetical protein
MASTATTRLRLEKQATGENNNAWGSKINTAAFDLIDTAIAGRTTFTLSGTKTLSSTNYVADESRAAWLDITSGTGGTVTIPSVEKTYIVRNNTSGTVVFTTGSGTTASLPTGSIVPIVCDATNVYVAEGTLGDVDENARLWLLDPTSAKLRAALTDETGTGSAVFANAPTLVDPVVGTQSQGDNSTKAASTAYVDAAAAAVDNTWTLIETIATTSGTSVTFDNIPATYQDLRFEILGVSHAGGTLALAIELSPDAATWTTTQNVRSSWDATTGLYGAVEISGYLMGAGFVHSMIGSITSDNDATASATATDIAWRISAGISAVRFSTSNTLDAGSIKLWGRK